MKWGQKQIAIFHVAPRDYWYAIDNRCPHEGQMVLSRGLIGETCGKPKVTCPLHKQSFSLEDGSALGSNEAWQLQTYPVRIEGELVLVDLPAAEDHYDNS